MTASWLAMTLARLAPVASSQAVKNRSGASATPSRDNNSYATTLRGVWPVFFSMVSGWAWNDMVGLLRRMSGGLLVPPTSDVARAFRHRCRGTSRGYVHVNMVAGPRCRTPSHAAGAALRVGG